MSSESGAMETAIQDAWQAWYDEAPTRRREWQGLTATVREGIRRVAFAVHAATRDYERQRRHAGPEAQMANNEGRRGDTISGPQERVPRSDQAEPVPLSADADRQQAIEAALRMLVDEGGWPASSPRRSASGPSSAASTSPRQVAA